MVWPLSFRISRILLAHPVANRFQSSWSEFGLVSLPFTLAARSTILMVSWVGCLACQIPRVVVIVVTRVILVQPTGNRLRVFSPDSRVQTVGSVTFVHTSTMLWKRNKAQKGAFPCLLWETWMRLSTLTSSRMYSPQSTTSPSVPTEQRYVLLPGIMCSQRPKGL